MKKVDLTVKPTKELEKAVAQEMLIPDPSEKTAKAILQKCEDEDDANSRGDD